MKKIGMLMTVVVSFSLLAGLISCGGEEPTEPTEPTEPAKPITLKYADYRPHKPGYFQTITEMGPWLESVEAVTDGRIVMDAYPSGALFGMPVTIVSVSQGVADCAFLSSSHMEEMPLGKVMALPPLYDEQTAVQNNMIYWFYCWDYLAPFWAEENIIDLGHLALHPYLMMTATTPVYNCDDISGVTLISTDDMTIRLLSSYGAIMQPIGNLDGYEALSKGVADGGVWNWEGPALFGWWDAFDPGYYMDMGGVVRSGGGSNCIMNLDSYNNIPADLRETFTYLTWRWSSIYFAHWIDDCVPAFMREAEARGIEYIVWSAEEKAKFNEEKVKMYDEWIQAMEDEHGLGAEAAELVAIYHKACQEYIEPIDVATQPEVGATPAEQAQIRAEWEKVYGPGSSWGLGYKAYPNQISTHELQGGKFQ